MAAAEFSLLRFAGESSCCCDAQAASSPCLFGAFRFFPFCQPNTRATIIPRTNRRLPCATAAVNSPDSAARRSGGYGVNMAGNERAHMSSLLLMLICAASRAAGLTLSLPSQCGRAPAASTALTVNGEKVAPGAFPWHTAIYLKRTDSQHEYVCGGSLISSTMILTAAHCFFLNNEEQPADKFTVALGKSYSGWDHDEGGVVHKSDVKRIVVHPLYQGVRRKYANDVAILDMKNPPNVSKEIFPICISQSVQLSVGEQVTVVGWGSEKQSPLQELESVTLKFKPFSECVEAISHSAHEVSFVTSDKFCSPREVAVEQPAGLAKGDSGGGVVAKRNGRWHLVGLVSVALDDGKLYVFTDMKKQAPWIMEASAPSTSGLAHGLRWDHVSRSGQLPDDAIRGGYQRVGGRDNPHFVGRVFYKDAIIPATVTKYGPHWDAFTAWKGEAYSTNTFEVARADDFNVRWVPATSGTVPDGATVAGISPDGENLYICRTFDANPSPKNANHFQMLTVGVLQPSKRVCTIEFYGAKDYKTYEVLVVLG